MQKIKVIITNNTGSSKVEAELFMDSGIIKFETSPVSYSHIYAVLSRGSIIEEKDEQAPKLEEKPVQASVVQSQGSKSKKSRR